jgi:hypothetical protein
MKPLVTVVVVGAAALAACQDATSPANSPSPSASVAATTAPRPQVPGLSAALGDASSRLSSSMKDEALRARLNAHLTNLSAALDKGDDDAARRTLALARKTLERLSALGDDVASGADLDGIGLALDQVESALNGSTGGE